MKTKLILSFLFIILSITACNTTEPPPPPPDGEKPTLELKLEDVSCIEAWIELTTTNLPLPATITLKQFNPNGDTLSQVSILNTQDSLLYIDSLLPNKNYQYQVSSIQYQVSGNELSVTTMDTSSHNFTFETFTFGGDVGSSTLYDIAIINENYIIAVGTVFLTDSLGQPDPQPYGVAVWDGQRWELKKIFHSTNIPVTPRGILVINPNEIYLAAGSIFRWDGVSSNVQMVFSRLSLPDPNATIEKLWGNSSSSIYGVGNSGSIVFYNGTRWSRIESGTTLEFMDIYGVNNSKTGKQEILAVCTQNLPLDKAIFIIDGNTATQISSIPIQWELFSCWFVPNKHYYVVGSGIYEKNILSDSVWQNEPLDITHYGTSKIRGIGINDVFVVGAFGEILHFNGFTWKSYLSELGTFSGSYGSLDIKENLVAIAGFESAKAKITIGHR